LCLLSVCDLEKIIFPCIVKLVEAVALVEFTGSSYCSRSCGIRMLVVRERYRENLLLR